MEFISQFFHHYIHYLKELWLPLVLGFIASGIFYQFFPTEHVQRYLGGKGIKPILMASMIGAALPVCCIGTLPLAMTLRRKQASLGAVMAFLVATPATSISALFVCWKLLGTGFTVIVFMGALLMSIVVGIICDGIKDLPQKEAESEKKSCCHAEKEEDIGQTVEDKVKKALVYAFVTLPKNIGLEILLGIGFSSLILSFTPIQNFIQSYLKGLVGYAAIIVLALVTYVCSTGDVPIAHAFIQAGMSKGQGLCYLLIGPITSYSTILVVDKQFGRHVLMIYLSAIVLVSFLFGMLTDIYFYKFI